MCADCSYSRSSSVTFGGVWGSHGTLDQDIDRPTQLRCLWPQNLEPTTSTTRTSTARTVAIFIQAPVQDPPRQALVCWLYSCVSYIPPSGATETVVSSAPIINVPTQLNSTEVTNHFASLRRQLNITTSTRKFSHSADSSVDDICNLFLSAVCKHSN